APVNQGFWTRGRKVGAGLLVVGVAAAIVFGLLATPQPARFTLSESAGGATLEIGGVFGAVLFGLIAAAAGAGLLVGFGERWFGWLLGTGVVGFVLSFLCWQISAAPAGQNFMPMVNMVRGTFLLALPLIFGALAGVLCERSGVVNVAIEGQLLMGAFAGALIGTMTGSLWAGLVAAALGGAFISLLLAVFTIRYLVDQVVMGIVLNLLAIGLTGFLYERLMQTDSQAYNQPPRFGNWKIPLLSDIPVIGPALFSGSLFLYLALILVVVIQVALFRTRWGLRTRSVGEHPTAADTLGVRVLGLRYRNVLLGGVVAGLGGASYTLVLYSFTKNMIGGKGFIALAALIFGRWSPTGALLAALFFGFADQLGAYLGAINSIIPSQFLAMLPYLATILAVAGLVGRVRAPAADGKPYIKG
ncbi:MAG TPA: ABC transporter permease, partial [Micromonosporaceae bacterium]|nr:ABC transporter permease [Micromonosporaceae bacterium]